MTAKFASVIWLRIGGWIARLIVVLFIALEVHTWPDILVFQPEEYERLIGGEAGCGKFKAFCSWPAFVMDQVPFSILAILSSIALLWRRLPRRELALGVLVLLSFACLGWRVYWTQVEASMSEHRCQHQNRLV